MAQLRRTATDQLGLRGKKGRPISPGYLYALLTNPFYYGHYEYPRGSGNWYEGKHPPMITPEEYDRVQILLGRKGRPRPKSHVFAFTGTMRCGECGYAIVAQKKVKRQKNGKVHEYTYYGCSKRGKAKCKQRYIPEADITAQGCAKLDELDIPDPFHRWAMKWLEQENAKEVRVRGAATLSRRNAYDSAVRKLDRLIEMRARDELTEDEFREKKSAALAEKARLHGLLEATDARVTDWADKYAERVRILGTRQREARKRPAGDSEGCLARARFEPAAQRQNTQR